MTTRLKVPTFVQAILFASACTAILVMREPHPPVDPELGYSLAAAQYIEGCKVVQESDVKEGDIPYNKRYAGTTPNNEHVYRLFYGNEPCYAFFARQITRSANTTSLTLIHISKLD